MSKDFFADISAMHDHYGMTQKFDALDREKLLALLKFRLDFIREELDEGYKALEEGDADGFVDACIDRIVVDLGTLHAISVDAHEAWERVLKANMSKLPGIKESRPNPFGLPDLIKPEGWVAPTHADNVGRLTEAFE